KVDSGEIVFNNQIMKRYRANYWDALRNRHFGYIFQNYHLLPELTVYQNLEFVLKMFHLSKEEIDQRIEYALNAVGMFRFRKRKPSQLSGGQQQRVAIARALVKSPDVVIADEPTGNLDEKNTTQIMNIIKKISKECLVILVTHERRLAQFYSDYIIEIADGSVVGQSATAQSLRLYQTDDRNIYLQEFQLHEYRDDDIAIKYFYSEKRPPLELSVIYKDGTFYLSSKAERVKFIDSSSEIQIIDAQKPVINSESIEEFDYYLPPITDKAQKKTVIGFKNCVQLAFSHLKRLRRRQKLTFVVFLLSAIMVVIGFINLFSALTVSEKDFLYFNRDLVHVYDLELTERSDLEDMKTQSGAEYLLFHPSLEAGDHLYIDVFYQNGSLAPIIPPYSAIPLGVVQNPEEKLILGRLPENDSEILIDKYLVDALLEDGQFRSTGIKYYEQFLDISLSPNNMEFEIVGIINNNNPNFYLTDNGYKLHHISGNYYHDFEIFKPNIEGQYCTLADYGNDPETATYYDLSLLSLASDEIIVSEEDWLSIRNEIFQTRGIELKIVGIHNQGDRIFISQETLDNVYLSDLLNVSEFTIYSNQKEYTMEKLKQMHYKVQDLYKYEHENKLELTFNFQLYVFAIVILIASCIFLYFLMRSSLFSRIYQVGIYRALGVRKSEIYKIFLTEILAITLLTSIVGIIAVTWIINEINGLYEVIYFAWYIPLLSFVFVLVVNIITGLLPVFSLMRSTPAQILSKYDI
ncbi:MAG: ATP-binding cassette domain-containing protein, partial [Acholeplasmataceae bacterium]|nr:ATP-binding cassette domain-containing protein [Acholeplasmataceae bacterium]